MFIVRANVVVNGGPKEDRRVALRVRPREVRTQDAFSLCALVVRGYLSRFAPPLAFLASCFVGVSPGFW